MRVSLIAFDFGEFVVPLASALAEHAQVQLVVPHGEVGPLQGQLSPAVEVHAFDKPRLREPRRQIAVLQRLLRAVHRFGPDVVHLQQGQLWFNLVLPLLGDVPLVVTVHDPRAHYGDRGGQKTPQWVTDLPFRRSSRVITHAASNLPALQQLGLSKDRVTVLPLAFVDRPLPVEDRTAWPPEVLFFGRIWPYKGLEHLIGAAPSIVARVPGARVVIAGKGEDLRRYRGMMRRPEDFVVHDGFVPIELRDALFDRCAVVVLPYVEATQTGVVPLAHRHGKPDVATTEGGLPEGVPDGRTGLLVPPADQVALSDAVVRLLLDDNLRRSAGRLARQAFQTRCDAPTLALRTLDVYDQAMGRSAVTRAGGVR